MEPFIGQIIMFGGNFAPRGWALCDGQLLAISSNAALFSILGTTYGGDGRTSFGLPDLRGRCAIHAGNGPGLSDRRLGAKSGAETHTLTIGQMPSHTHSATGNGSSGDDSNSDDPDGAVPGLAGENIYSTATPDSQLNSNFITVGNTGGNQSHNNMQPFLAVNFIIALVGIFPSRS